MTPYEVPETVIRRFMENGCEVTAIVADPADAQQTLYGTVSRDGALVGSYYCADRVRQVRLAHRNRPRRSPHPRRPTGEPGLRRCRRHRADHHSHRPATASRSNSGSATRPARRTGDR